MLSLRTLGVLLFGCVLLSAEQKSVDVNNTGAAAFAAKDYLLAGRCFRQALNEAGPDPRKRAAVLRNIAAVDKQMGRYEEAETLYRKAVQQHKKAGDRVGEAIAWNSIGETKRARADIQGAIKAFRKAEGILQKHTADGELASVLNNLGVALAETGNWDDGMELLERSLALRRNVFGSSHPETVIAEKNLQAIQADRVQRSTVSVNALRSGPLW